MSDTVYSNLKNMPESIDIEGEVYKIDIFEWSIGEKRIARICFAHQYELVSGYTIEGSIIEFIYRNGQWELVIIQKYQQITGPRHVVAACNKVLEICGE